MSHNSEKFILGSKQPGSNFNVPSARATPARRASRMGRVYPRQTRHRGGTMRIGRALARGTILSLVVGLLVGSLLAPSTGIWAVNVLPHGDMESGDPPTGWGSVGA